MRSASPREHPGDQRRTRIARIPVRFERLDPI
jgi:hypothetical protein